MPSQSIPQVSLYIRITENGKRRYERVNRRNPQTTGGVYCLHFYENGKRKWQTVGTDLNAASTARLQKESSLLQQTKGEAKPSPAAPRTLEELRTAFLHDKRTTFKKDGTPLDSDTIRSYEQVTTEFLSIIKRTIPSEITKQDLKDWMTKQRDLVGKIQQVTDPTGTYGFSYDNMGRLIGTTTQYTFLPGHNFQNGYTYDAASNRKGLTAPDGSTNSYNYDTLNRLTALTNSLTGQFGFGYDALSRRTQLTRPNGVNTNYGYDSVSHLLSVLHQAGSTTLDGASYGYDYAGNRTSKTNYLNGITEGYSYDNIYELTQVVHGATTTESYSYDAVGNRLSSLGVSPYSYNTSNELTGTPSGSYTYDNNGNTLTDASGKSYSWDFENRLTQAVVPGTGTTTFKYDPFGRRIQKSGPLGTTNYLYDGNNLVEEVDQSGNVLARFTQSANIDEPLSALRGGTTSYYQQDGLGSVTSLSNSAGALANTYTYDGFGKLTASSGTLPNPFQYTGREFDPETGIYQYRARYLDQNTGRFISQDPAGYKAGMNVYRYARNNPIVFADPSGLCEISFKIKLWSSEEVTIGKPASDWELIPHQENADGILPINNLWCHWTREYNTTIHTTTTYLVEEICDGVRCGEYAPSVTHYLEKETTSRPGTTTKTWDYARFTVTGFDSDFLEELYCNKHKPPE